jgi:hypothetical protein
MLMLMAAEVAADAAAEVLEAPIVIVIEDISILSDEELWLYCKLCFLEEHQCTSRLRV